MELERIDDLIERAIGKKALVVDPACLDEEPMGWTARPKFYSWQVVGKTGDLIVIARKLQHQRGGNKGEEIVREYVPISGIKRLTVMKGSVALHL